jgi:glycogen synthase kinase 3 beta
VDHPNIINLKYYFFTRIDHERTASDGNAFLNLVMEYLPETLFGFIQRYNKRGIFVPSVYIKLAMYQITRAMGYLHFQNICHRDIKPHNILINEQSGVVKICDLGSMKKLEPGSPNVSYICSRYFRAPELLLGCQQYSCAIDAWAIGCVMAEMYLRHPIFPGHNTQDQLARIIHILGSPSIAQLKAISLECKKPEVLMQRFPVVSTKKFTDILPEYASNDAIDLLGKLLVYVPQQRSTMPEALCHPFFDELHVSNHKLPNGNSFPPLFNFTNEELQYLQMEELDAE